MTLEFLDKIDTDHHAADAPLGNAQAKPAIPSAVPTVPQISNRWSAERIETLRTMWAKGFSCSQIAAAIGDGITRNAVIGKCHRIGLGRTSQPSPTRRRGPGLKPARVVAKRKPSSSPARVKASPRPAPPVMIAPDCKPVYFMELKSNACRWPIDEPKRGQFIFCGGKKAETGSYCPFHRQLSTSAGTLAERAAA